MIKQKNKEHDLVKAVREMAAHRKGKISLSTRKFTPPDKIDVASIRKKLGYNQQEFADHFGLEVSAVRDWEQGRRTPERTARAYLSVIKANPKAIERIFKTL